MTPEPASRVPLISMWVALGAIPLNVGMWWLSLTTKRDEQTVFMLLFTLIALGQFVAGMVALITGIRSRRRTGTHGVGPAIVGAVASLGALGGWLFGVFLIALGSGLGGAWGRPLRVRGRQLHPELREGSDWTRGARPNPAGLEEPTRAALEALWLHDAQKEHASVPAFARISWMLAAVGAPADLVEWSHRAALEEIEHTRLCFALAAGYAGRSHSVEPMPDILIGGLDVKGNALVVLATESLGDGCQLEDFNADVAAECARVCEEPATRAVLEQVAREERTHAEFSWAVLQWLVARDPQAVAPAVRAALAGLERYARPTAVSWDKRAIVERADASVLRRHGRLADARWGELWDERLAQTRLRVGALLGSQIGATLAAWCVVKAKILREEQSPKGRSRAALFQRVKVPPG